jgi:hypothetical protein
MSHSSRAALFALGGLALAFSALRPPPAAAAFIATERLLRACSASDARSTADCTGYIVGVADAAQLRRGEVCVPAGVSVRGLREAVLGELRRHPGESDAAAAVMAALRTLYPCPR